MFKKPNLLFTARLIEGMWTCTLNDISSNCKTAHNLIQPKNTCANYIVAYYSYVSPRYIHNLSFQWIMFSAWPNLYEIVILRQNGRHRSAKPKALHWTEAACGIGRAGMVGVSTDPGVWGWPPNRRRPVAEGEAGQSLDSRMPLDASNYINFTKSDSDTFNFPWVFIVFLVIDWEQLETVNTSNVAFSRL